MSSAGNLRTWRWALGSILAVLLLVGGAYIAHHAVVNTRIIPPVPAPVVPPLEIVAVTAPGPSYELLAQDAVAGHVVALASASQPICPPIGLCPPPAPLASFVVFDEASGTILSQTPLRGSAARNSVLLLVNGQSHIAYAVAPMSVSLFSTVTGASLGGYTLPASISWHRETGGVYDAEHHSLVLVGDGQLVVLDATTGRLLIHEHIADVAGTPLDGPELDSASGTLYLLMHGTATTQPELLAYDAATLEPLSQLSVPEAMGLGPLTPDGQALALYEPNGAVSLQPALRTLRVAAPAQVIPAAAGAKALGWSETSGHTSAIYVATATGIELRDASTGRVLASLPIQIAWAGSEPLLVDAKSKLIYLPGAHGQVVIARDTAGVDSSHVLNADTAVVLAHSALANFLPFTNQDPPFITPETFLLSATAAGHTIPMTYWIHYVDFQWSLGPYPGTTSAMVTPVSTHNGGYLVTFTITWNETFLRTHSWVCAVAPDGSVALRSDSGDIVP